MYNLGVESLECKVGIVKSTVTSCNFTKYCAYHAKYCSCLRL